MHDPVRAPLDFSSLDFASIETLSLAKELLRSAQAAKDGRAARTLAKSDGLTVVLTVVPAGGNIGEHTAPGPVVIVPILGTVTFGDGGEGIHHVPEGQALFVKAGQKHHVSAEEDCAFLLIIGPQS